jgi:HlyD family secretion protein
MIKNILILLAIAGALFGLFMVFQTQKQYPVPPVLSPPATSPFPKTIAGSGIIEASSQNISIGSPFNEVITKIYVVEGDVVAAGTPLFQLDLRSFEAQAVIAQAQLNQAIVVREDKKVQFSFYQRLRDVKAVSEQMYQQAHYNFLEAEENVKVSQANLQAVLVNIERSTIRAPVDGNILQINIHLGEIAPVVPFVYPQSTWQTAAYGTLILMGSLKPLQIRVDIDEADAWRFREGAKATAYVRGNRNISFPLTYLRTEPFMIPKTSFTGETVERVDTRVLQVLYNFEKDGLPVYPGQVLNIFIETESPDFDHQGP